MNSFEISYCPVNTVAAICNEFPCTRKLQVFHDRNLYFPVICDVLNTCDIRSNGKLIVTAVNVCKVREN